FVVVAMAVVLSLRRPPLKRMCERGSEVGLKWISSAGLVSAVVGLAAAAPADGVSGRLQGLALGVHDVLGQSLLDGVVAVLGELDDLVLGGHLPLDGAIGRRRVFGGIDDIAIDGSSGDVGHLPIGAEAITQPDVEDLGGAVIETAVDDAVGGSLRLDGEDVPLVAVPEVRGATSSAFQPMLLRRVIEVLDLVDRIHRGPLQYAQCRRSVLVGDEPPDLLPELLGVDDVRIHQEPPANSAWNCASRAASSRPDPGIAPTPMERS